MRVRIMVIQQTLLTNASDIVLLQLIALLAVTRVGPRCVEAEVVTRVVSTLIDIWRVGVGGRSRRGQVRGGRGQGGVGGVK